jgi:hypothetical protein
MDEIFVITLPVVAFLYALIALARTFSDHRVKTRLIQASASPETAGLVLAPSARRDLYSELKWGIVTVFSGLGVMGGSAVAANQPLPADFSEPFAFGFVLVSAGVGLIVYYVIAARMLKRATHDEGAVAAGY